MRRAARAVRNLRSQTSESSASDAAPTFRQATSEDVARGTTQFVFQKEKLFALNLGLLDHLSVYDQRNQERYRIRRRFKCGSSGVEIVDTQDLRIYLLKSSSNALRSKQYIYNGSADEKEATLKRRTVIPEGSEEFAAKIVGITEIVVWRNGNTRTEPWLQIRGQFGDFEVVDIVQRKVLARMRYWGRDEPDTSVFSYRLTVFRGTNTPFVLAVVMSVWKLLNLRTWPGRWRGF